MERRDFFFKEPRQAEKMDTRSLYEVLLVAGRQIMPKIALFLLTSLSAMAETSECIFNEEAFRSFVASYADRHDDSNVDKCGNLLVSRNGKHIVVEGGGCMHLGSKIKVSGFPLMAESEFLEEVKAISSEFGSWLVSSESLSEAIENKEWQRHEGVYFFKVNGLAAFEAWQESNGDVLLKFHIN